MLIPTPSQDSLPPPPYTSTSVLPSEPATLPLTASLRGGDARPSVSVHHPDFESAAAFFDDRPCTIQYPSHVIHHVLLLSPTTTRDHLPFPHPEYEWASRDVSVHDWNTFLNYLLPPEPCSTDNKDTRARRSSKEALRYRDRIQAVLAEWHKCFFGPRGIHLEARFPPASSGADMAPPPAFISSVDVAYHPEATSSVDQARSLPLRSSEPPMPSGQSPLQWARTTLTGSTLTSGPLARLLSHNQNQHAHNRGDFRSRRERHRHEMRERRSRSSSSSSSSSSISDSSLASISSSEFSGVDLDQVRQSLASWRKDPDRKAHLAATVRQFKSELRQSRRQYRDSAGGLRNEKKERKGELKAQRKVMKAELKSFIKEARAAHKADRKVRKAERKAGRAQRRAETRGMDAHGKAQRKVAKAEARALKAQTRALVLDTMARARSAEAGEMSSRGQVNIPINGHAGGRSLDADARAREQDLAERVKAMAVKDSKEQESGVCVKEG